jgi:hypothetical protein
MNRPKVFVLTLLAVRLDIGLSRTEGAAGASTIITVQTSHADAEREAWENMDQKFPASSGWGNHQVEVFELPDQIETDGYRVRFDITRAG